MSGLDAIDTDPTRISTGQAGLDRILDHLRIGDNVVWRVSDIEDYRRFTGPFISAARESGRAIIYLRFGQHPPLLTEKDATRVIEIDALGGFEAFTSQVWHLIEQHGQGAFYVCDCLSDLLDAWATDVMVGNFFQVICPLLYQLDTVAWFALYPGRHSRITLDRIRQTTQVMIDVYRAGDDVQIQPIKVWQRQSPTMFLPHREHDQQFVPVTDSIEATRLQDRIESSRLIQQPILDYWDRLFMQAAQALDNHDQCAIEDSQNQILQVLISRDPRMLDLARRYLKLEDLILIRNRMVGSGHIGGKTTGMLIARNILREHDPNLWQQAMQPHDSSYLGTDAYYAFLVHNGLWPAIMRQRSVDGYLSEAPALQAGIRQGSFPDEIRAELAAMLEHYGQYPILVRSSSLQEDSFGNAFAGKYDSVFTTNQGGPEQRLAALESAIRAVYASSMSVEALHYRRQRGLDQQEEPMALLIQRVNGRFHDRYYMPDAAGVAESQNLFTWHPDMQADAGMVRLVMGLGTRAVDRIDHDHAWVMALDQPGRQPFRDQRQRYQFSQHHVDVLDLNLGELITCPLTRLLTDVPDLPMAQLAETDAESTHRAAELGLGVPVWRLTFEPLLRANRFIPHLSAMVKTLEAGYQHPVEVEFTLHVDESGSVSFNLVQCRPMAGCDHGSPHPLPAELPEQEILFRLQQHFMGGNIDIPINRIIRIDPIIYAGLSLQQRYAVAAAVGDRVAECRGCQVLLIGPGRWGTSSPELGVPVHFSAIAGISVLVEVAEAAGAMVPDLSYGSHFFHNLVENGISYAALFPQQADCLYRPERLSQLSDTVSTGTPGTAEAAVQVYTLTKPHLRIASNTVSREMVAYFTV